MSSPEPRSPLLSPALDAMATTRRAILIHLRACGEAGAADIAATLHITPGAVRQQLRPLVTDGWVAHHDIRPGPGRPRRRYRLTPAASGLFPQAYGELAVEVLGHVAAEDEGLLERAFERRRQVRVAHAQERLEGRDFAGRVEELARILDEQGYMAEVNHRPDGAFALAERNCAILAVARNHRCACSSEIAFLREVLPGADVQRVEHIASGGPACVYEVRAKSRG